MSAEQGAEMALHPQIVEVTARVRERSAAPRARYLAPVAAAQVRGSARGRVPCTNLAHAIAAPPSADKTALRGTGWPTLALRSQERRLRAECVCTSLRRGSPDN